TAIGVAGIIFYCNMWAAASGDIVAVFFQMSLNDMIYIFRIVFFLGPIIGYIVTKRVCIGLQRKDREIALHGRETANIIRLPHGEFLERHEALPPHKLWKLTAFESPTYTPAESNADGKITGLEKFRAKLSRFFFEDRVAPVTKQELEASHHDHDAVESNTGNQLGY
ncbi:MAG: ubiquinol-cytochrome c reductase cytochrome b subunit, partial [Brevibacterium aurantiacum]